jgi:TPR repeat protein
LIENPQHCVGSSEDRSASSQNNYGYCLEHGLGVHRDLVEAAKYYKLSADRDDAFGQGNYGFCLEHGYGVPVNLIQAAKYYKLSADKGHWPGQDHYGDCLEHGLGVCQNFGKAAEYYKLSADRGWAAAQNIYGKCLEYGVGCSINLTQAAQYYQSVDPLNSAVSRFNYGHSLQYGLGLDADLSTALHVFQTSSDQGCAESSIQLALFCQYQDVDLDRAADFYKRATGEASAGIADAVSRCRRANGIPKRAQRMHGRTPGTMVDRDACTRSRPPRVSFRLDAYKVDHCPCHKLKWIGYGSFSVVTIETSPQFRGRIAVKSFYAEAYIPERFFREVTTLIALHHPNVLEIYGWSPPIGRKLAQIHTEVAEHGSLRRVLDAARDDAFHFWNPTRKGIVICGIVLGMRYVHLRGYIHRDLTPANILINREGRALIGDFGISIDRTVTDNDGNLAPPVHYAAPELLKDEVTAKTDVFSFGLVLYEILTGKAAFPASATAFSVIGDLRSGRMPCIPRECGALMQNLILRCWSVKPEQRPSFHDIFEEFHRAGFAIVPDGDAAAVSAYVQEVCVWEARNPY